MGRLLRVAGEGALAGLIAGAAFGLWETFLSRDLHHGMLRLGGERLAGAGLAGATAGVVVSSALAILLGLLARGGRGALRGGVLVLCLLAAAGAVVAAGPMRDRAFALHVFSSKGLSVAVALVVVGAAAWLLARRCAAALHGAAGPRMGRPATAGLAGLLGTGAVCLALPLSAAPRSTSMLPVILVSLDTLRADRLGVMGCPRPLTPRLDALASEGTLFEQAVSVSSWTLPSHSALFSSVLPSDSGIHSDHTRVEPLQSMLAERFRNAGYRTAAFTGGAYVSARFGFSQGFEIYEDHDESREGGPERIAAAALEWVRSVRGRPFFLFVHSYEVHSPFVHTTYAEAADAGRLARGLSGEQVLDIQQGRLALTESERRYATDLYDGDVARVDEVVGGLLETLRDEGILDQALLVVLSDHGEDLWDHEERISPAHGHSLYQEILHVPLIVRAPGRVRAGARIRQPVSLLDVAPTLLEMAGLPADPSHQGTSLARSLRAGEEPESRLLYSEGIEYGPDRFAVRAGNMKVIVAPMPDVVRNNVPLEVQALEVFDLASDPQERHDLSGRMDDPSRRALRALWTRLQKRYKPFHELGGQETIPDELREQMRSLGYVR